MRLSIAQIKSDSSSISANINKHLKYVQLAHSRGADLILFPELSLTAYEPHLARDHAFSGSDKRLDIFQTLSDSLNITILPGLPIVNNSDLQISMLISQPNTSRAIYSKQRLHSDESPIFSAGDKQHTFSIEDKHFAPAICYESLQPNHALQAHRLGANVYLAAVAKSESGVVKAFRHYPQIAAEYSMMVPMSNSIGPCDNFLSAGSSAIWSPNGQLLGKLNDTRVGLLMVDTASQDVSTWFN